MKRIFDPVHRFIELEPAEIALLDVPAVQRLRRLRQLGLSFYVFPSAEHSRFTHALGAMAVGTRAFDRIAPELGLSSSERARQRRLLRIALLLHDVGHGPFSHACEATLDKRHEERTHAILHLRSVRDAVENAGADPDEVEQLIVGGRRTPYPILRELVSGPNLDADRMDYLLRDSYFTGVASGRYDADQLLISLRPVHEPTTECVVLGIDARGVVALESFVLARYMMFASVYFHHTTRLFEHVLADALRELWPEPRALDDIEEFLAWDDFRVMDALRSLRSDAARALRDRRLPYALAVEFNAAGDDAAFVACRDALVERFGPDAVWTDEQSQLLHRLPLGAGDGGDVPTVWVATPGGTVDARDASDLIAKLSGKAYWNKIYVARSIDVEQARRICREITANVRSGQQPPMRSEK